MNNIWTPKWSGTPTVLPHQTSNIVTATQKACKESKDTGIHTLNYIKPHKGPYSICLKHPKTTGHQDSEVSSQPARSVPVMPKTVTEDTSVEDSISGRDSSRAAESSR